MDIVEAPVDPVVARPDGGCARASDLTVISGDDAPGLERPGPVLGICLHDENRSGLARRLLERLTF